MPATVALPTLHPGQVSIWRHRTRLNGVRCGRRWGKTKMMVTMAANAAAYGKLVGLFTPEHKQLHEPYEELLSILSPVKRRASKTEGTIRTTTGGVIDFWSLNDNELAGRGREYDLVMGDEMAYTKFPQMKGIWEKSIKPTMLTRPNSEAWFFSTPTGDDPANFFWQICKNGEFGFRQFYAPSSTNPYVPENELDKERASNHPLVFQQEFEARFVSWAGVAFFSLDKLLVDGQPVPRPQICDSVFAVIDSAVKSGKEHDGTAVSYWASSAHIGHRMVCLDWDIVSIDGALLEAWIPNVIDRCKQLARECHARYGFRGVFIEDEQSGSILLQQCALRGLPAEALPSKLTASGKDGRALNASSPVYRGDVKLSQTAFDKNDVTFKGATRNHLVAQVTGFRIGDKSAATRADDLLDTFTYAVAITCGNPEGIA